METVIMKVPEEVEQVDRNTYLRDALNGFTTFFDFGDYRFGEGVEVQEEEVNGSANLVETTYLTYYIMDLTDEDNTIFYKVCETIMTEFLKTWFCYGSQFREEDISNLLTRYDMR